MDAQDDALKWADTSGRTRVRQALMLTRRAGLVGDASSMRLFQALGSSFGELLRELSRQPELDLTLDEAAKRGVAREIVELESRHGGAPFERGADALGLAAHCGLERDVLALLRAGANPNARPRKHSAVACAAHGAQSRTMRALLDAGADAVDDTFGLRPLLWRMGSRMATPSMLECLDLLLAHPSAQAQLADDRVFDQLVQTAHARECRQRLLARRSGLAREALAREAGPASERGSSPRL